MCARVRVRGTGAILLILTMHSPQPAAGLWPRTRRMEFRQAYEQVQGLNIALLLHSRCTIITRYTTVDPTCGTSNGDWRRSQPVSVYINGATRTVTANS